MFYRFGNTKHYGQVHVLKGVDITVNKGEIVSIVGSSGAGKSTLLHILGTLDLPDSGTMMLNNIPVHNLKGRRLADFRNKADWFCFPVSSFYCPSLVRRKMFAYLAG